MTSPALDPSLPASGSRPRQRPRASGLHLSRRGLLGTLGGAALATVVLGDARLSFGAGDGSAQNVLVTILLGGGMDGLSAVVPLGDPDYATHRPGLAVPASATRSAGSLFGLHPALAPLYPLWTAGTFGAVHAVSQPSSSRSHFSATDSLDRASTTSSTRSGWLDRALAGMAAGTAMRAVSLGQPGVPGLLRGSTGELAVSKLGDVTLPVNATATPLSLWQQALTEVYAQARPEVSAPMTSALAAVSAVDSLPASTATAAYPTDTWGTALKDIARLIKTDTGLRTATIPYNSWDHHSNFGTPTSSGSTFAGRLSGLATGLAAFAADLGPDLDRVTVVTLTEFGRRVKQNGNGGLDHGHGSVSLLLGGGVVGGKVHGRWPGLHKDALDEGLDLAGTTDYRAILSEILVHRLGLASVAEVFPGYSPVAVGAVTA